VLQVLQRALVRHALRCQPPAPLLSIVPGALQPSAEHPDEQPHEDGEAEREQLAHEAPRQCGGLLDEQVATGQCPAQHGHCRGSDAAVVSAQRGGEHEKQKRRGIDEQGLQERGAENRSGGREQGDAVLDKRMRLPPVPFASLELNELRAGR
jgi:hypothetical protein